MRTIKRSLLVGLLGGMLAIHGFMFWKTWPLARQGYFDFTIFYTAGTMVRSGLGRHLYDPGLQYRVQQIFASGVKIRNGPLPYVHPPFEALLFVPLSLLDYATAYGVWDVLNVAALALVFFLLRRHVPVLERISPVMWLAIWLAFFPVFGCLLQGQDSILLLLLCALGYRALKRNADFLAGGWFALGTFKFQFMIPLVLLLMFWKRRRAGAGFVVLGFVMALLSAAVVGWDGFITYPSYILHLARLQGFGGVSPDLMPNLRGLVAGWPLNVSSCVLVSLVIASSVILFVFAGWRGRALSQQHFNLQFSLAVVVAVLIAWLTNGHDLSLLVLPMVLLADYSQSFLADAPQRKRALLIPVVPLLISPLWLALWLRIGKVNVMAIPLLWWAWEIGKEISRLDSSAPISTGKQRVSLC